MSTDCEFDEVKFKYLFADTNSGEVIDKSHWTEAGDEILYSCNETALRADFSDFPDERRAGQRDVLLTRNGTPYVHVPENGAIYTNVVQRVTLPGSVDRKYVAYALNHAKRALAGQGIGIESFNLEQWKNLRVPLPHQEKQIEIANFLDRNTAAIDELIDKKRRLIELLEEKRDAVINRAVTRGLDPDVAMKDSGVPWIGEVPENWDIVRLKFVMDKIVDCLHSTPEYVRDGEYPALRTGEVKKGFLVPEQAKKVTKEVFEERNRREAPRPGDIIYTREGDIGKAAPVEEGQKVCLAQRVMMLRPSSKYHSRFVMWQLNSAHVLNQALKDTVGSTADRINIDTLENVELAVPPPEEQKEVTERLQRKEGKLREASDAIQRQIEQMEEYRQSLITAAVTGQIDVEDYEPETDDPELEAALRN